MASYDLVERLNDTFRQLERELQMLQQRLRACRLLAARVFELPAVSKETNTIRWRHSGGSAHRSTGAGDGAETLQPSVHPAAIGKPQQQGCRPPPGAICLQTDGEEQAALLQSISRINAESRFRKIVTVDSGLPAAARFEWVHRHLPGLITLSAYRT
jgi:DNA replication terminus site-binding protein